jgi:O-antigen/teichoic acid export membrane protein
MANRLASAKVETLAVNETRAMSDVVQPTAPPPPSGIRGVRARILSRPGAATMVVLTLVGSAINYGSNLVFSRVLDPTGYGELTALFALSVVLAVPTVAAQTLVAERVAVYNAEGRIDRVRYLVRHALAHVSVIAGAVGLIYLAATPIVVKLLGLRHEGVAVALTPVIVLAFVQPLALGVLQGLERFVALGVLTLAIAVSRLAFGVPWAAVEHGPGGALGGQAVGMLVVLGGAAWTMRSLLIGRGTGAATTGLMRKPDARTLSAGAAFIGFAVLSNIDIVLAKVFLSPHDSGLYAALSTIGKIITFLPGAIAVVMVPSAAKARLGDGSSARVLRISALCVALTVLCAAIPAVAAPHLLINLMFGHKYLAAASGVLPIVAAGAGFAMTYLLVVYSVAIHDRRWVLLLACAAMLQVAGISAFHHSPTQVAIVQAMIALFVLTGNEILFHPIISRKRGVRRRLMVR